MTSVIAEDVYVEFPIYGAQRSFRRALFERATGGMIRHAGDGQDRTVIAALNGISFELHEGDRLGVIGHNGAGKSTLLQTIAGIFAPSHGRMFVQGNVTPLINSMPGFDGEDSGYENIITAGLLLGMTREEVTAKIPDIEEFSELGEYLTLPVRTYSTGMAMRLSFSLATAMEPGILLIDEGIGTGDARFQERARQRLDDFIGRSRIVVMASHSSQIISAACNKAALLNSGRIIAIGPVAEVLEQYEATTHGATPPRRHPPSA